MLAESPEWLSCRPRPGVARRLSLVAPRLLDCFASLVEGRSPWPLYLYGPVGVGKTCAALALVDAVQGAYWSQESLQDALLACIRGDRSADSVWSAVAGCSLACLDEIGSRAAGDFQYSTILKFWEAREERSRVAVYSSNLDPGSLSSVFDDRVASRLLCGTVFCLDCADRRVSG